MVESCIKVKDLLKVEKHIIDKNLDKYKWYRHLQDSTIAVLNFIQEYGGILKEMYCESACPYYNECQVYKKMIEDLEN